MGQSPIMKRPSLVNKVEEEEEEEEEEELTKEAVTCSQDLAIGSSRLADIVSRSRELAAEATKRADQIKAEAIKHADQIKFHCGRVLFRRDLPHGFHRRGTGAQGGGKEDEDLERFGLMDELREFVRRINVTTFRDFPFPDGTEMLEVPPVSNVRQDLTEFQEQHAKLVLSSVKDYESVEVLENIFHTSEQPHYPQYMEDRLKASEEVMEKSGGSQNAGEVSRTVAKDPSLNKTSTKSSIDQDPDVFLLGDLGDDEEGTDEAAAFMMILTKMVDSSDDDEEKAELI